MIGGPGLIAYCVGESQKKGDRQTEARENAARDV